MSKLKTMKPKQALSLIGVFLFFFLLFNFPFIGLPSSLIEGYPALILYIGLAWFALILIMARMDKKKEKQ